MDNPTGTSLIEGQCYQFDSFTNCLSLVVIVRRAAGDFASYDGSGFLLVVAGGVADGECLPVYSDGMIARHEADTADGGADYVIVGDINDLEPLGPFLSPSKN